MSTLPVSNVDSRFSFRRVLSLAAYYRPMIEKQTIVYLIASVVFAILTLLPVKEFAQMALFTICWTLMPYMTQFAPCLLAKSGDARIIERLIPATATEKFTFFLLYFLLVIPLAVYVLPYAALYLYQAMPQHQHDEYNMVVTVMLNTSISIKFINMISAGVGILMCLYAVNKARHNRVLKGIIAVFAVQVGTAILGAIWGFSLAFKTGYMEGIAGVPYSADRFSLKLRQIMEGADYVWIVGGVMLVWFILMLVLNYRLLKKQNL